MGSSAVFYRRGCVFLVLGPRRVEEEMTDKETIDKLQKQVKRLKKRLLEKKKYELGMLINSGATPRFIAEIDEKDQKAMSD